MDILRILDELNEVAVERPKSMLGFVYSGYNREEISMQISKVRASLPQELKQAVTTVRESERILKSARRTRPPRSRTPERKRKGSFRMPRKKPNG